MMTTMARSRMARCFGAAVGALVLAAALPATASADRDGRGWRNERHDDHGRGHGDRHWRGRDHRPSHTGYFRNGHRRHYVAHRHGSSCSHGPTYRYGYRAYPYAAVYRHGWFFGR